MLIGGALLAESGNAVLPAERVLTLEGRMASKRDHFEDPEVRRILLRLHITSAG